MDKYTDNKYMDKYIKFVGENELKFHQIAANAGIAPKIIEISTETPKSYQVKSFVGPINGLYLTTEKFSITLREHLKRCKLTTEYKTKIFQLITQLHELGIFHGDLHASNIVLNPLTNEVRLIDFETCCFIKDITSKILQEYNCQNLEELLDIDYDCFNEYFV